MTTMDPDSIAHLGVLRAFDRVFRPQAEALAKDDEMPDPNAPARPVNQQDEE